MLLLRIHRSEYLCSVRPGADVSLAEKDGLFAPERVTLRAMTTQVASVRPFVQENRAQEVEALLKQAGGGIVWYLLGWGEEWSRREC